MRLSVDGLTRDQGLELAYTFGMRQQYPEVRKLGMNRRTSLAHTNHRAPVLETMLNSFTISRI